MAGFVAKGAVCGCLLALAGCSSPPPPSDPNADGLGLKVLVPASQGQPSILVFTKTAGFRHDSIPDGVAALKTLAAQNGFGLTWTEDGKQFTDQTLPGFAAVIFLSTTGDILLAAEEAAFERYIAAGHGFVGIHAAADCEYDWAFYGGLVGAYFAGHSQIVAASVKPEPVTHASLTGVPSPWSRTDEWYGFGINPRPQVTVLLTVDESTYDAGQGTMGADHPVAWYHPYQGGRAFYTALGHTSESFSDAVFLGHLLGGIQWAAGLVQ
ncbi:MAG TPA: ThuA domain-containing protein [Polyangiaceae bacterium]|nr:ThuA domain-containing protein [Polyangiaceae bacterium]